MSHWKTKLIQNEDTAVVYFNRRAPLYDWLVCMAFQPFCGYIKTAYIFGVYEFMWDSTDLFINLETLYSILIRDGEIVHKNVNVKVTLYK